MSVASVRILGQERRREAPYGASEAGQSEDGVASGNTGQLVPPRDASEESGDIYIGPFITLCSSMRSFQEGRHRRAAEADTARVNQ